MTDTLDARTAALERRLTEYHRTGAHHTLEDMRAYVMAHTRGEDPPQSPLLKDSAMVARSQRRR